MLQTDRRNPQGVPTVVQKRHITNAGQNWPPFVQKRDVTNTWPHLTSFD